MTSTMEARGRLHAEYYLRERSSFRPEIQGLRAIAVISVVLFHIWPDAVPGGYVGVDVFFVISGYLITGLLFREAQDKGTISILSFYERRVRRLLPAASFVLMAVALATPLLPEARWGDTAWEIAASALYVENWRLAWLAVDYLGAENAPSAVQHYWSLSIEEQFYIIWPLVMIVAATLARRSGKNLRQSLFWTLCAISAVSFITSMMLTADSPESAYFVTHTRIWELGLGGLLALSVLPALSERQRELMRSVGLGAIVVTCFAYSSETAFPGYTALLPTLGTVLVIAAGPSEIRWSPFRLLKSGPTQYLGDTSYSMYLWHWPIITFYTVFSPGQISLASGLLIAAICVVISDLSKRFIEDPFRQRRRATGRPVRVVGLGAASITACVVASVTIHLVVDAQRPVAAAVPSPTEYPGVRAILSGARVPAGVEPIPSLAAIKKDTPEVYDNGCHLRFKSTDPKPCEYGDADSNFHVVLTGDSHAANWIPALAAVALHRGWRLSTHTKSSCPLLRAPVSRKGKAYEECLEWGERLLETMRESPPDLVIWTRSAGSKLWAEDGERPSMEDAIAHIWEYLTDDLGIAVIAIADTPWLPFDPPECLSQKSDCIAEKDDTMRDDPIPLVHKRNPAVGLIDMNDTLCTASECPAVIGNVIAWRDKHHLTATYSRGLAPILEQRIDVILKKAAK